MSWLKPSKKRHDPYDYICHQCAQADGANWPEGHVATSHMGECCSCHDMKNVCAVSDWRWPKYPEISEHMEV